MNQSTWRKMNTDMVTYFYCAKCGQKVFKKESRYPDCKEKMISESEYDKNKPHMDDFIRKV